MKQFMFVTLLLLIPVVSLSQTIEDRPIGAESFDGYIVNKTDKSFHIVTPILLRNSYADFQDGKGDRSLFQKPGVLFMSSLILPGSGQWINRNPVRAGIYTILEITSIYMIAEFQSRGRSGERHYERFANNNWSVVQYAQWLVDYHNVHSIANPYLSQLRELLAGVESSFDTSIEWNQIDLNVLRAVERNTPYMTTDDLTANLFSHTLPAYGSQQYYELISKYYQFQAGWRDYHDFHNQLGHTGSQFDLRFFIDRNGLFASPFFFEGVGMSRQFNDDFRRSRTFLSLLIANHFISAFDAYFTISLKQNKMNATSTLIPGQQLILSYSFN